MESKAPHRLRITKGCMAAGQPCREGQLIEVDAETAYALLNLDYAEIADEATAKHFRRDQRWSWIDRDADQTPKIRLVNAA